MKDGATPSGAGAVSTESAAGLGGPLLTIGQVVNHLRPEFPDLSITKIRYLEDRGLVAPARTAGRYRKYSDADIRRLRTVLALQRDEYLPLEVIKKRLERVVSPLGQPLAAAVPLRTVSVVRREEPVYTQAELCDAAGVDAGFLRMLIEFRLLDRPGPQGPAFTETDLEVVRICQLLARFGVEPRNLRLVASLIEREAALVEQVTTPSLRSTHLDKREHGEHMLADLGSLLSQLTHLLLTRELRRLL